MSLFSPVEEKSTRSTSAYDKDIILRKINNPKQERERAIKKLAPWLIVSCKCLNYRTNHAMKVNLSRWRKWKATANQNEDVHVERINNNVLNILITKIIKITKEVSIYSSSLCGWSTPVQQELRQHKKVREQIDEHEALGCGFVRWSVFGWLCKHTGESVCTFSPPSSFLVANTEM